MWLDVSRRANQLPALLGRNLERPARTWTRNPGLADAIDKLHAGARVFAAVGALHMVGKQGLPALLQAKGFKVQRVF